MDYALGYFDQHPEYVKRLRHTTGADELIFSTVLHPLADQLKIEVRNSLRFVEWHPHREYTSLPLVLDEREFDEIVKSGNFFCRKVDLNISLKLIDMLDDHIEMMKRV